MEVPGKRKMRAEQSTWQPAVWGNAGSGSRQKTGKAGLVWVWTRGDTGGLCTRKAGGGGGRLGTEQGEGKRASTTKAGSERPGERRVLSTGVCSVQRGDGVREARHSLAENERSSQE